MTKVFPTATAGILATADEYNQLAAALGNVLLNDGNLDASRVEGDLQGGVGTATATKIALGVVVRRELNACDPAFGADPTGVADSTPVLVALIRAAIGGADPASSGGLTRTATEAIYFPPGTYRFNSQVYVESVANLRITGAGDSTVFMCYNTLPYLLGFNGIGYSELGHFLISTDSGSGAICQRPIAIYWDGIVNRTTTRIDLRGIHVYNCKYVAAFSLGGLSPATAPNQSDQMNLYHCIAQGPNGNVPQTPQDPDYWRTGVEISGLVDGSAPGGSNTDIINIYGSFFFKNAYGVYNNAAKGVGLYGCGFQDNGQSVFGNTTSYHVYMGNRDEGAGSLLGSHGNSSVSQNQSFRDYDLHLNHGDPSGLMATFDNPGTLLLDQFRISNSGAVIPYVNLSPGVSNSKFQRNSLLLTGVASPSSLTQAARGTARASVVSLSYTQIDQSSLVGFAHDAGPTLLGFTDVKVQFDYTGTTGSGCVAYATTDSAGTISGLVLVNGGLDFAAGGVAPAVAIVGNHGTGASYTPVLTGDSVSGFTKNAGGTGYDSLQHYGPDFSAGSLSTNSTPSVIDVSLYRRSAGLWGMEGNLAIGFDGYQNSALTVYSAIVGASSVLSGNDLNFQRLGISTIRSSGLGGVLILESPNAAASSALPRIQLGNGDISATDVLNSSFGVKYTDTGTGTQPVVALFTHRPLSGQVPAANYGTTIRHAANSDTTQDRVQYDVASYWTTATDASRAARTVHSVYDTAAREVLRMESIGGAAALGVLGAVATVRETVTGSRGGNAALADLLTKLATKGLLVDGSSA